jgi:hypothetical protein
MGAAEFNDNVGMGTSSAEYIHEKKKGKKEKERVYS